MSARTFASFRDETPSPRMYVDRYGSCRRREASIAPLLTVLLAFVISGVVVLLTTRQRVRHACARTAGSSTAPDWIGSSAWAATRSACPSQAARVWFPWNTNDISSQAAANLEQTLLLWTALVLVGLAVAFAFRCGLFNIGGRAVPSPGSIGAVLVATELPHVVALPSILLIVVSVSRGCSPGAALAGIAGLLKGTVGPTR